MEQTIIWKLLLLFFLALAAGMDMKNKRISVYYLAAGLAAGIVVQIINGRMQAYEVAGGCLLGALLLGIAFLTKQQIGYGDGLLFAATGAFLGVADNLLLFMISLLLAALTAVGLIVIRKRKRTWKMPFVPFVLAGYIFLLLFV